MTTVKDKEGHALGHIRYKDTGNNTIFIDMMENYKKVKGVVRTGVAQILKDNPDKKVYWSATSESSVKSYNKFCEEYPELAKRVEFEDRTSKTLLDDSNSSFVKSEDEKQAILDEIFSDSYNSEKGVIADERDTDSKKTNRGEGISSTTETDSGSSDNVRTRGTDAQSNQKESTHKHPADDSMENTDRERTSSNAADTTRNESEGVSETVSTDNKKHTSTSAAADNVSPEERLVNSNGNIEAIAKALDDTALNLDPQTFENIADNADAYYNKLAEAGITDVTGLKEAFAQGDINYVKFVVSKQLAAQRLISDLMEEVKQGADDIRVNDIFESINYLQSYKV